MFTYVLLIFINPREEKKKYKSQQNFDISTEYAFEAYSVDSGLDEERNEIKSHHHHRYRNGWNENISKADNNEDIDEGIESSILISVALHSSTHSLQSFKYKNFEPVEAHGRCPLSPKKKHGKNEKHENDNFSSNGSMNNLLLNANPTPLAIALVSSDDSSANDDQIGAGIHPKNRSSLVYRKCEIRRQSQSKQSVDFHSQSHEEEEKDSIVSKLWSDISTPPLSHSSQYLSDENLMKLQLMNNGSNHLSWTSVSLKMNEEKNCGEKSPSIYKKKKLKVSQINFVFKSNLFVHTLYIYIQKNIESNVSISRSSSAIEFSVSSNMKNTLNDGIYYGESSLTLATVETSIIVKSKQKRILSAITIKQLKKIKRRKKRKDICIAMNKIELLVTSAANDQKQQIYKRPPPISKFSQITKRLESGIVEPGSTKYHEIEDAIINAKLQYAQLTPSSKSSHVTSNASSIDSPKMDDTIDSILKQQWMFGSMNYNSSNNESYNVPPAIIHTPPPMNKSLQPLWNDYSSRDINHNNNSYLYRKNAAFQGYNRPNYNQEIEVDIDMDEQKAEEIELSALTFDFENDDHSSYKSSKRGSNFSYHRRPRNKCRKRSKFNNPYGHQLFSRQRASSHSKRFAKHKKKRMHSTNDKMSKRKISLPSHNYYKNYSENDWKHILTKLQLDFEPQSSVLSPIAVHYRNNSEQQLHQPQQSSMTPSHYSSQSISQSIHPMKKLFVVVNDENQNNLFDNKRTSAINSECDGCMSDNSSGNGRSRRRKNSSSFRSGSISLSMSPKKNSYFDSRRNKYSLPIYRHLVKNDQVLYHSGSDQCLNSNRKMSLGSSDSGIR